MRDLGDIKKKQLLFFVLTSFLIGLFFDISFGHRLDNWIHDSAIVFQHRTEWKHSGIVVLDDEVPFNVGRKQALSLFALATERLIAMGAKGVFLDARIPKELEGRMPYAQCIKKDGSVHWSSPECSISPTQQCRVDSSEIGQAPLKMNKDAIKFFRIAPYLNNESNLPDFLLFGFETIDAIPEEGLVVSDRLVTFNSPIARWVDLSKDHAVHALATFSQTEKTDKLFKHNFSDKLCNEIYPCRRIRLSKPNYGIELHGKRLILPVSRLASCDEEIALQTALLLRDKVVILQTTAPNESTDLVVTAMTTALFGPKLMTPGAQYLIDEVETLINQDSPKPPNDWIKITLFITVAIGSVLAALFFHQMVLRFLALGLFVFLTALCFLNPIVQLWPVMATMVVCFFGIGQVVTVMLFLGAKEGRLVRRYIPEQVRNLLMPLKPKESFENKRCHVVVLMSDLAGYTTVTGLIKEPRLVLEVMNDYLSETSYVLQKKYGGILEAYVGDMVCYYWRVDNKQDQVEIFKKALLGAIELRELQKNFFISLQGKYKDKIDQESLKKISNIIDAGIGVTEGNVVMGDLGPEYGVKKFGILGDPLNLAARIEGLTRLFNTDIIIAGDFLDAIKSAGLSKRKLGVVRVKGRVSAETLYALGSTNDLCFETASIKQWEQWRESVETKSNDQPICPDCYTTDKNTIKDWLYRGLLSSDGVWYLDNK